MLSSGFQLLIFGFAVNLDVDTAKIAWMDQDRTPESRALRADFEGSGRFLIAASLVGVSAMPRNWPGAFKVRARNARLSGVRS